MGDRLGHASGRSLLVDGASIGAIVAGLPAMYLTTYAVHGYAFPVGPDAPVYIWWARLAGHDGLAAVRGRPGVPAVVLALGDVLHLKTATSVAVLEIVLAVCVALGVLALVSTGSSEAGRWKRYLASAFAGLFAAHLAVGYVATLMAAALFLAASACFARGSRAGAVAAGGLLGSAALAHPSFGAIGGVVLALTTLPTMFRDRRRERDLPTEVGRLLTVLVVAGLTFAAGLLALNHGASAIHIDTSRDDVMQSVGLGSELPGLFRERLIEHGWSYALLCLPFVALGIRRARGFLRSFLLAWAAVLVLGGGVAFVTGWFPAERLVTFGFAIPIGLGLGIPDVVRDVTGRGSGAAALWRTVAGWAIGAAVVTAFVWPTASVWLRTPPKLFPLEVQRVTEASRFISAAPPGTRLVFTASGRQPVASFFWTEAGNAIRAAVPAARIRDVRVVLPSSFETVATQGIEDRLVIRWSETQAFDGAEALADLLWFDLAPFDRTNHGEPFGAPGGYPGSSIVLRPQVSSQGVAIVGPHPGAGPPMSDPLEASSFVRIALGCLATLALVEVIGFGWAWSITATAVDALPVAPAAGMAILMATRIAAAPFAVAPSSLGTPLALAGAAAGGGYVVAMWLRRTRMLRG
jgi:hypothetical protein